MASTNRVSAWWRAARPYLPPGNFITYHYVTLPLPFSMESALPCLEGALGRCYFITLCFVSSLIFWGSSSHEKPISFSDSLFLVISACTETGLNSVNLSEMTTWQQVILWLLIILGSSIWVSIWTIMARKHAFETRFRGIVRRSRLRPPKIQDRRRTLTEDVPLARKLNRAFGWSKVKTMIPGTSSELDTRRITVKNPTTGSSTVLRISGPVAVQKLGAPVPRPAHGHGDDAGPEVRPEGLSTAEATSREHISFVDGPQPNATTSSLAQGQAHMRRRMSTTDIAVLEADPAGPEIDHRQFLTAKKIGRNAQFHDLTSEEREHLGGTEYRALKVLSILVPVYFATWQVLGCVALGAWIANNQRGPALANGINPWWNGIFNGVSAFNNSGMSVLDANMTVYSDSYFVLVCMGAMILAGNTAYPVFLRFWLWSILKLLELLTYEDSFGDLKLTLEYILKYPRRVYTNLFPSRPTWWLLFMLFVLNGIDWVGFEILNFGNPALEGVPVGSRIIDGLFQALAVRSGGFYVVNIAQMYIGLQVLYVIMMYISVYPVVITMRHSNVYEERSLGVYADDMDSTSDVSSAQGSSSRTPLGVVGRALHSLLGRGWDGVGAAPQQQNGQESKTSFISHQMRGQLSHDLWLLVLAVWAIATIETRHFLDDPATFSVFNIIFEVVSAYGTVGISVGVPFAAYSFSGAWYTGSKLVLCLVMLRGRHRGLPVALDRAVRLPGEELARTEEEDHRIRRSLSMRRPSTSRDV